MCTGCLSSVLQGLAFSSCLAQKESRSVSCSTAWSGASPPAGPRTACDPHCQVTRIFHRQTHEWGIKKGSNVCKSESRMWRNLLRLQIYMLCDSLTSIREIYYLFIVHVSIRCRRHANGNATCLQPQGSPRALRGRAFVCDLCAIITYC